MKNLISLCAAAVLLLSGCAEKEEASVQQQKELETAVKETVVEVIEQELAEEGHGHHHVSIDFTAEAAEQEAINLQTVLQLEEKPLTQADVSFEIWQDGDEKHEYVAAVEQDSGTYSAAYQYPDKGTYIVNIHVVKGELHDHQEQTISIK
ncbi:hypothetical protein BTO30_16100 [Domibacillus antri]|uniref:YtkA-like domain-containing protein n=1 Tax=Domibacillus antri TaxID=1714264 RepID=A0A1Q8Q1P2_9BACI|nr:FixH family protein [Domibacillus antri]OLN21254.1 hypothetical protein BTO30_16100 [Domibacillus antri]